jgi:DNA-binding IclR family transcriptional regulator
MSILDNVQRLLKLYACGSMSLSFTEVADQLALPKGSASHLLHKMAEFGLLEQDPATRRYRPSRLLAQAAHAYRPDIDLDAWCWEVQAQLSDETGLTSYLSTLQGAETVVIKRVDGRSPVQVVSSTGSRRAACDTAMGRALLSRLSPAELHSRYGRDHHAPLLPPSEAGLPHVGALERVVHQAFGDHHAVLIDAAMPGIGAVAAAVRIPGTGELRGFCVSFIAGVHAPMDTASVDGYRRLILDKVGALGQRLGDPYWMQPLPDAQDWTPAF